MDGMENQELYCPWKSKTASFLGCTEAAFLAVAYLFLLLFIIWICSLVFFLMPAVFLARGGWTGFPQRPRVQLSGLAAVPG